MTAITIDKIEYGKLLAEILPMAISNDAEIKRLTIVVNDLATKGMKTGLSPEKNTLLRLETQLINDYERVKYPIENAPSREILQHFLEVRGLQQKDLLPFFGSKGIISEILSGKRHITINHAK